MHLALRNVTKRFGSLVANDRISFTVEPGEIHCLLGENGAGKSTLMNVLYGLYSADEGEILVDDVVQDFAGPGDAIAAGIGMVHQHFMLVPTFTVAENVMLGDESVRPLGTSAVERLRLGKALSGAGRGFSALGRRTGVSKLLERTARPATGGAGGELDLDGARRRVREISARFGFDVDPDALVEDLPVGVQQRVEIIKVLSRNARVLVFDEPTAVLTPQETDELMQVMRQLRDEGIGIVFITHKLREVRAVADRITVIRRGKVVGEASPSAESTELAALMVGRPVELTVRKDAPRLRDEALVVRDLTVTDDKGLVQVDGLSFTVRGGEILGVAGVQGNGQTELAEALLGLQKHVTGSITLDGQELLGRSVRQCLDAGVGFVPEDRQTDGLVGGFSIAENLMLDRSFGAPFVRAGTLQRGRLRDFAQEKLEAYDVRAPGIGTPAGTLSGGNQQKVVVARELSRDLRLLVASQPTRGVDVGSIEFIHQQVVVARDSGIPVLVISAELDEVVALADRILVMYRGQVVGIVPADTPRDVLGLMMAGEIPAGVDA